MEFVDDNLVYMFDMWFAPLLTVVLGIILVMIGHIFRLSERLIFALVYASLAAALIFNVIAPDRPMEASILGIVFDSLGKMGLMVVLAAFVPVVAMLQAALASYHHKMTSVLLLLISLLGCMVAVISHNWMILFAAIQCLSLPTYAMLAFDADHKLSVAASVRYLVLSSVSMAFMLFGIMALYAATGTVDFYQQSMDLPSLWPESSALICFGFAFIMVGMAFKLSLSPFHMWAPEVYQGAKPFLLGHLAVVSKCAIFIAFARSWFLVLGAQTNIVTDMLGFMAILSMWIGAGLMLYEKNFIRVLAYLSISHLGFLLTPLFAKNVLGVEAILIDLMGFGMGMFLVLGSLWSRPQENHDVMIDDFMGQIKQNRLQSVAMFIGLMSLAGVPLTTGFLGKYAVFSAVIDAKLWNFLPHMIISSLLGIVALAKYMLVMFEAKQPKYPVAISVNISFKRSMAIVLVSALLYAGIFPDSGLAWIKAQSVSLPFFTDLAQLTVE